MDAPQNCLSFRVFTIDGQSHQFLHSRENGLDEIVEYLRRTKVFGQTNLVVQADEALTTFPSKAVARLDIISNEPLPPICPPTWAYARELSEEEFLRRREEIHQLSNGHPRNLMSSDTLAFLVTYDLLGGYRVFLEAQVSRTKESQQPSLTRTDVGIVRQHAQRAPITFDLPDGGVSFLNTANLMRTYRYPGGLRHTANIMMFEGSELRELDGMACERTV